MLMIFNPNFCRKQKFWPGFFLFRKSNFWLGSFLVENRILKITNSFVENRIFGQNFFFVKNRNISEKSRFQSKISFGPNYKFWLRFSSKKFPNKSDGIQFFWQKKNVSEKATYGLTPVEEFVAIYIQVHSKQFLTHVFQRLNFRTILSKLFQK